MANVAGPVQNLTRMDAKAISGNSSALDCGFCISETPSGVLPVSKRARPFVLTQFAFKLRHQLNAKCVLHMTGRMHLAIPCASG